jgi:hypothetical protein
MNNLQSEWTARGELATQRAASYGNVYAGSRAAMVFDCVMSRRRRYESVVLPLVAEFRLTPSAVSLRALAERGPGLATSPRKTRRRIREWTQSRSRKVSDWAFPRIQLQPLS